MCHSYILFSFLFYSKIISDPTYTIQTGPNKKPSSTFHIANKFMTFKVRGCKDATLLLSSTSIEDDSGYAIILGAQNNEKIYVIDLASQSTTEYAASGLLECNTFRPFWLAWHNEEIIIGRGVYLSHILVTHISSSVVNIQYIRFSSEDANDMISWEIPKSEGE